MTDVSRTRLSEVLEEQFRTKAGLARALGVSRNSAYRWVTGEEPVPAARQVEIAALLRVPREELFGAEVSGGGTAAGSGVG